MVGASPGSAFTSGCLVVSAFTTLEKEVLGPLSLSSEACVVLVSCFILALLLLAWAGGVEGSSFTLVAGKFWPSDGFPSKWCALTGGGGGGGGGW